MVREEVLLAESSRSTRRMPAWVARGPYARSQRERCAGLAASVSSYAMSTRPGPEGHNLVVGVMPDVGASQPWNPRPPAPVTGDLLFVHSEIRFVRRNVAATAKHDARHPPDFNVTGDVKQQPVNPVHCLS